MIATLTLNPSLDQTVTVEGLVLDEANRWTRLRRDPGGKGINVSRVVYELDGDTVAYGFIGGLDGRALKQLLAQQKVPFDFTSIEEEIRSNFIIHDLATRRQTRIDAPGPHISSRELAGLLRKVRRFEPKPDFLVLAGSVPPGVPADIYRRLIEDAKRKNVKTVLDSDGVWLKEGIKAGPNIIKPNVHEAEELLGRKLKDETAIIQAAKTLHARGIEMVAISRGKEGIILVSDNAVFKGVPPELEVNSAVGAGDATVAGLVLQLSRGKGLDEACRLAVAAGAAVVLTPGTELCHRADVERILPLVRIETA